MSWSDLPLYDAAKALSHCEICIQKSREKGIGYFEFEFYYNAFMIEINRFKDLTKEYIESSKHKGLRSYFKEIERMTELRQPWTDPLLSYVRYARNSLSHQESILWDSLDSDALEGIGAKVNMGKSYSEKKKENYSTSVLPNLSISFDDVYIAAKPVIALVKQQRISVPVPTKCCETSFDSTPQNLMIYTYEYYGQQFEKITGILREDDNSKRTLVSTVIS